MPKQYTKPSTQSGQNDGDTDGSLIVDLILFHRRTNSFPPFKLGSFIGLDPRATNHPQPEGIDSRRHPEPPVEFLRSWLNIERWFKKHGLERSCTATEIIEQISCKSMPLRPAGDHPGVNLIFDGCNFVVSKDVLHLARLLDGLGGDSPANFLKIHHARYATGQPLHLLQVEQIHNLDRAVYSGNDLCALYCEAESDVLARFGPDARSARDRGVAANEPCQAGLVPGSLNLWITHLTLGNESALLVALDS